MSLSPEQASAMSQPPKGKGSNRRECSGNHNALDDCQRHRPGIKHAGFSAFPIGRHRLSNWDVNPHNAQEKKTASSPTFSSIVTPHRGQSLYVTPRRVPFRAYERNPKSSRLRIEIMEDYICSCSGSMPTQAPLLSLPKLLKPRDREVFLPSARQVQIVE